MLFLVKDYIKPILILRAIVWLTYFQREKEILLTMTLETDMPISIRNCIKALLVTFYKDPKFKMISLTKSAKI